MSKDHFGYYQVIPENIREVFMWLCQDVADLRTKWNFYLELFSSEESTELLNDIAPASFHMIEESLRREMMMAICRLSDPVKSREQDNLSLRTLVEMLDEHDKPVDFLDDFRQACKLVRIIRNKRLGHNDLNTRIKPQDNPLPGIGRTQIEQIIVLGEQILNFVYQRFENGELRFRTIHEGGADTLLFWLRKGREYGTERKRSLLQGTA
ncbi:MAG TPA: hypothetical protein VK206_03825 [Anaerolineales bacterium]|nr:hypothetical protein [Anaerolineales bacterium]